MSADLVPTRRRWWDRRAAQDDGFTMIELLVVTIVLSTLAAISIPTYMGQTRRAFDSQMKSSLRSLATSEETFLGSHSRYGTIAEVIADGSFVARSSGVTLTLVRYLAGDGYCLEATHDSSPDSWWWDSKSGGLQPAGSTSCPLVTTGATGDSLP